MDQVDRSLDDRKLLEYARRRFTIEPRFTRGSAVEVDLIRGEEGPALWLIEIRESRTTSVLEAPGTNVGARRVLSSEVGDN